MSLNKFSNVLTGFDLKLDGGFDEVKCNSLEATNIVTTDVVKVDGSNDMTGQQRCVNIIYNTRNIFCNGQNPALNIITDVDATQYRQVFVNTTSVETDGCSIDRIKYVGTPDDYAIVDIYVNLATLKLVHNQGGLGPDEYALSCPDNIGFTAVSNNVSTKYRWVRLFFNYGLGAWYAEEIQ